MADFSDVRLHRSRQRRRCDWCERGIHIGDVYAYLVGKVDGEFRFAGYCLACVGDLYPARLDAASRTFSGWQMHPAALRRTEG